MSNYTVKALAKLSGVSVRTLHHYDEKGLLKPAAIGANGYRYYGREELLRLQQILFHRQLGLPLATIARLLDAPQFDRVASLRAHRAWLAAEARRHRRLIRTIDDTLAALEGDKHMDDEDIYAGFAPQRQAEYEAWLIDRFGPQAQADIEAGKSRMKDWSRAQAEEFRGEMEAIEAGMAKALADGAPADSAPVRALMARHHAWVARSWGRAPDAEAFIGLGRLYLEHPDFRAHYEGRQAGLTEYLAAAMRAFVSAEPPAP